MQIRISLKQDAKNNFSECCKAITFYLAYILSSWGLKSAKLKRLIATLTFSSINLENQPFRD
jgi:hypothetical protein